jgi:hypothetical protein
LWLRRRQKVLFAIGVFTAIGVFAAGVFAAGVFAAGVFAAILIDVDVDHLRLLSKDARWPGPWISSAG